MASYSPLIDMDPGRQPPGDDWHYWGIDPPRFNQAYQVIEVWHPDQGDETKFWRVEEIPIALNTFGLWWREA